MLVRSPGLLLDGTAAPWQIGSAVDSRQEPDWAPTLLFSGT